MPRAGLSREAVTALAIGLIDTDAGGFERLSLSAVAAEAGVAVPSLYKHVASLADLRRCVSEVAVAELARRMSVAAVGRSGEEALGALAAAIRSFARDRPGLYAASQVAPDPTDPSDESLRAEAAEALAVVAAALREFGSTDQRLVDAVRAVRSAVHGFVALEAGGGFGLPDDVDRSFEVLVQVLASGLRALPGD